MGFHAAGNPATFSAKTAGTSAIGLPCTPMYVCPGTEPPVAFEDKSPQALPINAPALLYRPSAPVPEFNASSSTIGPLNTAMPAIDDVELDRALVCEAARARIAGNISGLAPAMTALTATVSTLYSHASRSPVTLILPTISVGACLVFLSIAATRSSVGMMMGSWSDQNRSSK